MQFFLKRFLLLYFLALGSGCKQEDAVTQIPVESFFKSPIKFGFQISPDGNYISYLQPYKNRYNLFVKSLTRNQEIQITKLSDRNVAEYFWLNNEDIVYTKDWTQEEDEHLYAVRRNGENNRDLLPDAKGKLRFINSNRKQSTNSEVLIALNRRDASAFDAYRLNIYTRSLTMLAQNPGSVTEWFADRQGEIRLAIASDSTYETLLYRADTFQPFKKVFTNNFKTTIDPIGFCRGKRSRIYALSNKNRDKAALVELDCESANEIKVLYSHPEVDVIEPGYSFAKGLIQYVSYTTSKKERMYLDKNLKAVYSALVEKLPRSEIRIADKDSLEKKFIVRTFTDKTPGAFYLYSPVHNRLRKLADVNPAIDSTRTSEMKPVTYLSRDGKIINAYLTIPYRLKPVNLPVVVMPHNGPSSRAVWGYNSEVQFLVSRGYVVFQPNFRGSTGYGKEFWIAGFKKWGTTMQNDITDGVRWLVEKGIADKKRIAVYGTGFGGYSALHGLCFNPDLYACGISYSGPVNLFSYVKEIPSYNKPYLKMYYEMIGNPEKDVDYFRAVSPVFHSDRIKAPVFIAQGTKDKKANINDLDQFVKDLKGRNIPVSYMLKDGEGTYFSNRENRVEFYQRLEDFLADYLKKK